MGKARRKQKAITTEKRIDATPERLAMGESEMVNPAEIDSKEQANGYTRRFMAATPLDRWYRADVLTYRQFKAGEWYRTIYEYGNREPRVIATYGEFSGGGGETDYGLARTRKQLEARATWRAARDVLSDVQVGVVDRFVLRNALPTFRGRKQMSAIDQIRGALDTLADYLKL